MGEVVCFAGLRGNLRKLQGCRAYLFRIEPASQSLLSLSLTAGWQMLLKTESEVQWRDRGRKFRVQITQGDFQVSVHIRLYKQ